MSGRTALQRVLTGSLIALCACALALGCLIFIPAPFGYRTYSVTSSSMAPHIPLGSLVFVDTSVQGDQVQRGDVVAFDKGGADETVCIHRARSIDQGGGLIETKGDANETADLRLVPFEDVQGTVRAHVPFAGFALMWVQAHRAAFAGVAAALALASISLAFASPTRPKGRSSKKGTECLNRTQQIPR